MKQRTILLVTATLFLTTLMTSCRSGKADGCGYWGHTEQNKNHNESMKVKDTCPEYHVHLKEVAE